MSTSFTSVNWLSTCRENGKVPFTNRVFILYGRSKLIPAESGQQEWSKLKIQRYQGKTDIYDRFLGQPRGLGRMGKRTCHAGSSLSQLKWSARSYKENKHNMAGLNTSSWRFDVAAGYTHVLSGQLCELAHNINPPPHHLRTPIFGHIYFHPLLVPPSLRPLPVRVFKTGKTPRTSLLKRDGLPKLCISWTHTLNLMGPDWATQLLIV